MMAIILYSGNPAYIGRVVPVVTRDKNYTSILVGGRSNKYNNYNLAIVEDLIIT